VVVKTHEEELCIWLLLLYLLYNNNP
jgi:hypothetical protein